MLVDVAFAPSSLLRRSMKPLSNVHVSYTNARHQIKIIYYSRNMRYSLCWTLSNARRFTGNWKNRHSRNAFAIHENKLMQRAKFSMPDWNLRQQQYFNYAQGIKHNMHDMVHGNNMHIFRNPLAHISNVLYEIHNNKCMRRLWWKFSFLQRLPGTAIYIIRNLV